MASNSWMTSEKGLRKIIEFTSFTELTRFLAILAPEADIQNHHPDLRVYKACHLEILLITHDEKNITIKDFHLAETIDKILENLERMKSKDDQFRDLIKKNPLKPKL